MNIFVTDCDPQISAQNLCDKHVGKMLIESAQLLCTVYQQNLVPYKHTHINHPCAKWVRASQQNYDWLLDHAMALCIEFEKRYKKIHKTQINAMSKLVLLTPNLPNIGLTSFVQAMPDKYKNENAIIAYRNYYINEKTKFAKWNYTEKPFWWIT